MPADADDRAEEGGLELSTPGSPSSHLPMSRVSLDRRSGASIERYSLLLADPADLSRDTRVVPVSTTGIDNPLIGGEGSLQQSDESRPPQYEPGDLELRDEARPTAREVAGVYAHFFCLGWMNSIMLGSSVAYCYYVMDEEPNRCNALNNFSQIAWCWRFPIGAIQDAFQLSGSHRRAYILVSWVAIVISGIVLATYADQLSLLVYGGAAAVVTLWFVCADVAADAILLTFTGAEAPDKRGGHLANAYSCRFLASMFGYLVTGFLFNGHEQGGDFDFSLTLGGLWWVAVAPAIFSLLSLFPYIREPTRSTVSTRESTLTAVFSSFCYLLGKPAPARVCMGFFFVGAFSCVTNYAQISAVVRWAGYSTLMQGVDQALSYLLLAVVLLFLKRHCLSMSWRKLYAVGVCGGQAVALGFLLIVYCCPLRNGWFFVFLNLDSGVAADIAHFLGLIVIPEISEPGLEAVTYGAVTTVINAAGTVAAGISNELLAVWDLGNDAIARDDATVREHVTMLQLVCTGFGLMALAFIPIIPQQRDDCRKLSDRPSSGWASRGVLALITLGMVWGTATSVLPLLPLGCSRLLGGPGCGGVGSDDGVDGTELSPTSAPSGVASFCS